MRLPRKHIPIETRCRITMRQLGELWPGDVIRYHQGALGALLKDQLEKLAEQLGCKPSDLRLDHDPPLAARRQIKRKGKIVGYVPHEHAPDHLKYRPHGPEFAGSHLIKTNVRGDNGQHPDRVLIKKARRLEQCAKNAKKPKRPTFRQTNKAIAKIYSMPSQWPKGRPLRSRGFRKPGATA